jgi:hypothetical protein
MLVLKAWNEGNAGRFRGSGLHIVELNYVLVTQVIKRDNPGGRGLAFDVDSE